MQKPLNIATRHQSNSMLQELEETESAIAACRKLLSTLQHRHDALTIELERITMPSTVPAKLNSQIFAPALEYRGTVTTHWNYIDVYLDLLRRLWIEFPDRREQMARRVGMYGTMRAYIAKSQAELFPGQPIAFAYRHSRMLVEGWYADTNINVERMRRILPAAVAVVDLKWGEDVKAWWRAQRAPIHI